jgi:hypothetical protein
MRIGEIDSLGQIKIDFSQKMDISADAKANVNKMFGMDIQAKERIPGTRLLRKLQDDETQIES